MGKRKAESKRPRPKCDGCGKPYDGQLLLFSHGRHLCPKCDRADFKARGVKLMDELTGRNQEGGEHA